MVWPVWVLEAANLVVGLGFCLGILLMNFPQHYQCWKHRSAEGLSLAYILICTISNVTLWLATLLGDYNTILEIAINYNATTNVNVTTIAAMDDASSRILIQQEPQQTPAEEEVFPIGSKGQLDRLEAVQITSGVLDPDNVLVLCQRSNDLISNLTFLMEGNFPESYLVNDLKICRYSSTTCLGAKGFAILLGMEHGLE